MVGAKNANYWNEEAKGQNCKGKIIMGYNYGISGCCGAFGTDTYTMQLGVTNGGDFKFRMWYPDNNTWIGTW